MSSINTLLIDCSEACQDLPGLLNICVVPDPQTLGSHHVLHAGEATFFENLALRFVFSAMGARSGAGGWVLVVAGHPCGEVLLVGGHLVVGVRFRGFMPLN